MGTGHNLPYYPDGGGADRWRPERERVGTAAEPTGWLTRAAALCPLERGLVRGRRESPTAELLICRLRA